MTIDTSIECIPFKHNPATSPDVSPMCYCSFGILKRAPSKQKPTSIDGLWKDVEDEWKSVGL